MILEGRCDVWVPVVLQGTEGSALQQLSEQHGRFGLHCNEPPNAERSMKRVELPFHILKRLYLPPYPLPGRTVRETVEDSNVEKACLKREIKCVQVTRAKFRGVECSKRATPLLSSVQRSNAHPWLLAACAPRCRHVHPIPPQPTPTPTVDAVNKFKAFEAVFRVSCQQRGAQPYKPLLRLVQEGVATGGGGGASPCERVSLSGVGSAVVCAAAAALAGYPDTKHLCLVDCSLGDGGLAAISALLRASGGRWWRGSRLLTVQIQQCGREAAAATLQRPCDPHGPSGAAAVPEQFAAEAAARDTGGGPLDSSGGTEAGAPDGGQHQAEDAEAGPALEREPSTRAPSPPPVPTPSLGDGWQPLIASQPAASQGSSGGAAPSSLQRFPIQLSVAQAALRDRGPLPEELPSSVSRLRTPLQVRSSCMRATLPVADATPPTPTGTGSSSSSSTATCSSDGQHTESDSTSSSLTGIPDATSAVAPPCFGPAALKDLALALSVSGLKLSTLTFDFTQLGDAAVELLASGLQRCSGLTALSLRCCGIGPGGARALAAALTPPPPPPLAAAAVSSTTTTTTTTTTSSSSSAATAPAAPANHSRFRPPALALETPCSAAAGWGSSYTAGAQQQQQQASGPWLGPTLKSLSLSGNPIGGAGVLGLNALLRRAVALEALGLADVGLTDCDAIPLQGLVSALTTGCPAIAELDLDRNYIGGCL
jgi:hypothetical protein